MNSVADSGLAPHSAPHATLQQLLDLPVMCALVVVALIALTWICWKAQSKD